MFADLYMRALLLAGFESRFQKEANLSSSAIHPSVVKVLFRSLSYDMFIIIENFLNLTYDSCFIFLIWIQPPEYMPENLSQYSAWVGGAILAKVVFPQNQHVTKADYDENGPAVVHRKCFWLISLAAAVLLLCLLHLTLTKRTEVWTSKNKLLKSIYLLPVGRDRFRSIIVKKRCVADW